MKFRWVVYKHLYNLAPLVVGIDKGSYTPVD